MKYEKLLKTVYEFFGDTSHSPDHTKDKLEELVEEIKTMIEVLKLDIKEQNKE